MQTTPRFLAGSKLKSNTTEDERRFLQRMHELAADAGDPSIKHYLQRCHKGTRERALVTELLAQYNLRDESFNVVALSMPK